LRRRPRNSASSRLRRRSVAEDRYTLLNLACILPCSFHSCTGLDRMSRCSAIGHLDRRSVAEDYHIASNSACRCGPPRLLDRWGNQAVRRPKPRRHGESRDRSLRHHQPPLSRRHRSAGCQSLSRRHRLAGCWCHCPGRGCRSPGTFAQNSDTPMDRHVGDRARISGFQS
jgi:hypothetical protein